MDTTESLVRDLLDIKGLWHRNTLRLGMMHYHLKPGGVVSVMRDIVSALKRHSRYELLEMDVFASFEKDENAREIFGSARDSALPTKLRIYNVPRSRIGTNPVRSEHRSLRLQTTWPVKSSAR